MAGTLVGGPSRNPFGGRGRYRQMAEINVTPFVDVMLVLLIVFMVTAPLLTVGIEVNLPETAAPALSKPDEPLEISVDRQGRLWIQEREVEINSLVPILAEISEENRDLRIYIRGDRTINYGRVLEVMGLLTSAGYRQLALVSAPGGPSANEKE